MLSLAEHLNRITPIHAMPPDGVSVEDFNESYSILEDAIHDMENTLGAIADPDDYEKPHTEKTVELCRKLAADCMARLNL